MLFVLHTKVAQFNWEVAEKLAFLVDPRQVKLLEASGSSLVPLPAHLALLCTVLSPCQCCLWNPSPSQTCGEQAETEEGAAQIVWYVACTCVSPCHSLIGRKECGWFEGLSGRNSGSHSCGWGAHLFTHPVPGWVFSLFFISSEGWPEGGAGIWDELCMVEMEASRKSSFFWLVLGLLQFHSSGCFLDSETRCFHL